MPIGAIHINEAPQDFEFRVVLAPTYSQTPPPGLGLESSAAFTARQRVTYGVPYLPTSYGFEAYVELIYSNITLLWTWSVTITTPFGSGSASGTGFFASISVTWQFQNLYETVNSACDWELGFDALVVKVDAATVLTLGPTTQSGIGFDRREATNKQEPTAGFDGGAIESETNFTRVCALTLADQTEPFYEAIAALAGGWRFKVAGVWTYDDVDLDSLTGMETGCACFTGLQNWRSVDSWNIENQAEFYDRTTKTDQGNIDCDCPEGTTGDPSILNVWKLQRERIEATSYIKALPSSSGIPTVRRQRSGLCHDGPVALTESEDLTQTTGTTISEGQRTVVRNLFVGYCAQLIEYNPCSLPDHAVPDQTFGNPGCGDEFVDSTCAYTGSALTTHPDPCPCSDEGCDVDEVQSADGEHALVYTPAGSLWVKWSPFTGVQWRTITNITAGTLFDLGWERPRIAVDANGRYLITAFHTNQGGADPLVDGMYAIWSDDNCATWGPVTAGDLDPEFLMACRDVMTRGADDGPLMRIRFICDSGFTGVGIFQGEYKPNPDATWSAPVTCTDQAASDLRGAGFQWGFDHASEHADRWSLSFVPEGGSDPVTYYCADITGFTWTLET